MKKYNHYIMGLVFKLVLLTICLFIQSFSAIIFSQKADYIAGEILNSSTSDSIPFSTIRLKNKQLSVFANSDGEFKIINNPDFKTDRIIITCIGFKRSSVAFNNLNDKKVNKIFLNPAIYRIGEVKISSQKRELSSPEIIAKAIRNIRNIYPMKPFSFIGYYRDYQKKELFNVDIEYGYENPANSLMYLKYISFNNILDVVNPADTNFFKITDSYWDPSSASTIIFKFNNKINKKSAQKRDNYDIKVGGKTPKINQIMVKDKILYIRLANIDLEGYKDSAFANILSLEDIDGISLINERFLNYISTGSCLFINIIKYCLL